MREYLKLPYARADRGAAPKSIHSEREKQGEHGVSPRRLHHSQPYRLNQAGFTLLELLIVVFILSAIAFSTVAFTNNADEQFRFEETRTRLENVRRAVVGDPARTLNGEPAVSGFVADIGRLPNNLQELVEQGALPQWAYWDTGGVWGGWRGPYLTALTESGGTRAFRDGWGNAGAAPNYGWTPVTVMQTAGTIDIKSVGSDGAGGGTGYAADYPPTGFLVEQTDHQLNLRGWTVTVTFFNPPNGGPALPAAAETLRVRIYYPEEGAFGWPATWPPVTQRDNKPYLSLDFPLAALSVPDGGTLDQTFDFGTAVDKFVPWGGRSLAAIKDADGSVFVPAANQAEPVTLVPRTNVPGVSMTWNLE